MKLLITAGGTREYLDPVRFISNASSGRMGLAIARAALRLGHSVTVISAADLKFPVGCHVVKAVTSEEMLSAVQNRFKDADCLIMAAAVADFKPVRTQPLKIKKTGDRVVIELEPTVDILEWAGMHKRGRIVVGFALEDEDIFSRAEEKMRRKGADIIVANAPSAIGGERSTVYIKAGDGQWQTLADVTKARSGRRIIAAIEKFAAER